MARFLLRIVLFLMLSMGIVSVWKARRQPGYGNPYLRTKLHAWDSQPLPADRLVIGSSRLYRGLIPSLFDSLAQGLPGTRTMNLAAPAVSEGQALRFVEDLLQDEQRVRRIRTLIIELQDIGPIEGDIASQVRETYWHSFKEWCFITRSMFGSDREPTTQLLVFAQHGMATYRSTFAVGEWDDLLHRTDTPLIAAMVGPLKDGFASLDRELSTFPDPTVQQGLEMRRTELLEDPGRLTDLAEDAVRSHERPYVVAGRAHVDRLLALIDGCKARKIDLLFVVPPRSTRPYPLAVLEQLPEQVRIDLSDPRRYPDLYDIRYSFDLGHLDRAGAERMTRHLVDAWKGLSRGTGDAQAGAGAYPGP